MRRGLALGLLLALAASPGRAGEMVHGADSAFAGRGAVVVWAVQRTTDEVVLRVAAVDPALGALTVDSVDPFTERRVTRLVPSPLIEPRDLRLPRAGFAEHPRTELSFARRPEDLARGGATLTIYFSGVPDTTPELSNEAMLAQFLAGALRQLLPRAGRAP
ncbi:MAG: hypothetical protein HYR86_12265 [Candidatus Rokubacteria bacterium]|nr:hypothetical protein [Candidatus Rokubacteria bacterium]